VEKGDGSTPRGLIAIGKELKQKIVTTRVRLESNSSVKSFVGGYQEYRSPGRKGNELDK